MKSACFFTKWVKSAAAASFEMEHLAAKRLSTSTSTKMPSSRSGVWTAIILVATGSTRAGHPRVYLTKVAGWWILLDCLRITVHLTVGSRLPWPLSKNMCGRMGAHQTCYWYFDNHPRKEYARGEAFKAANKKCCKKIMLAFDAWSDVLMHFARVDSAQYPQGRKLIYYTVVIMTTSGDERIYNKEWM